MLTVQPSLTAWLDTLARSHSVQWRADLYGGGDLATVLYPNLPISGGQIVTDQGAATRRTLDLTLVDDDVRFAGPNRITPNKPGDMFTPYGNLIKVSYAVQVPGWTSPTGDSWQWFPQGLFRIHGVPIPGDGTVQITATDLSSVVAKNRFTAPYVVAAGTPWTTAIPAMVLGRLPAAAAAIPATVTASTEVTPLTVVSEQDDPWATAQQWAADIGYEVFFGRTGSLTLQPVTDVTATAPLFQLVQGVSAILTATRNLSDDPGINGELMTAESTTLPAPLSSIQWDVNPNSPTYYLGPYGQVPDFRVSKTATTQTALDAAAKADLVKRAGGTEEVTLSVIPDPAWSVNDVFGLTAPKIGMAGEPVITDRTVLPLELGTAMQVTARRRRITTS